jgi:hypothetical protein
MAGRMDHPSYRAIAQAVRRRATWTNADPLRFPEQGAELYFVAARSRHAHHLLGRGGYRCEEHGLDFPGEPIDDGPADCDVAENVDFRYPLLRSPATWWSCCTA